MNDLTFDRNIAAIAARATFPAPPPMRTRVLSALEDSRPAPASQRRAPLAFAAVAAIVAAAAVAATMTIPSSRSAVADFFGVQGSEVEPIPDRPLPPPEDIRTTAQLATVDEASDLVGFDLSLPPQIGEPPSVYVLIYGTQHIAVIRYDEFDLWQARLPSEANFGKGAPPDVIVEDTFVDGTPARWITGGPHFVAFIDATGKRIESSERPVYANTLIWNDGDTFFRIETQLPFDDALRIAESLP
jgi:hypothetical protein